MGFPNKSSLVEGQGFLVFGLDCKQMPSWGVLTSLPKMVKASEPQIDTDVFVIEFDRAAFGVKIP